MSTSTEIQVIAILISIACALPGCFLVVRSMAMLTDAISHTILLGIVLAYLGTQNLDSPLLMIAAAAMGVFTVFCTEAVSKTRLIRQDAAIGFVYPLFFSIAIILITKYADSIHLDLDSVMTGELAFAPFNRLVIAGHDLGSKALYIALVLVLINTAFIVAFFKELKLFSFDPILATILGFSPTLLHYGFLSMVSITAVGAFEGVGSILVIAFMVIPANAAYLLTQDLGKMLVLSCVFATLSAVLGFQLAYALDVSISGMIATISGILFFLIFLCSPKEGLLFSCVRRRKQQVDFAKMNLLFHVGAHENTPDFARENGMSTISNHLYWDRKKINYITSLLLKEEKLELRDDILFLTETGRETSQQATRTFLRQ